MQNNIDRVDEEIKRVLSWSLPDRLRLLENLKASISQGQQGSMKSQQRRKAREFKGACRETWKDVDVEEYLRQERASWDY